MHRESCEKKYFVHRNSIIFSMTVKTPSFLITGLDNDELVDARRANPVSSNSPTQASTPSKRRTFSRNCPVLESLLLPIFIQFPARSVSSSSSPVSTTVVVSVLLSSHVTENSTHLLGDLSFSSSSLIDLFLTKRRGHNSSSPLALFLFDLNWHSAGLCLLSKELLDDPPLGKSALARLGRGKENAWLPLLACVEKASEFMPRFTRRMRDLLRANALLLLLPNRDSVGCK